MNNRQASAIAAKLAQELQQRTTMQEQMKQSPFTIHVLSFALRSSSMKTTSSFIIYLHHPMSIAEIRDRMWKGFGDIKQ